MKKNHKIFANQIKITYLCRVTNRLQKEQTLNLSEMDVLYSMRNGESNRVALEEATNIANEVMGLLDAETATKSGSSRRIASMTALLNEKEGEEKTKSGSANGGGVEIPDTLAYLFNFDDGAGFTIIAADTRIPPILCFTGIGTLDDTNENPGVDIFLEGMGYYMERSIAEAEAAKEILLQELVDRLEATGVSDTTYLEADESISKVLPLPTLPTQPIGDDIRISYSYGAWTVFERTGPMLTVEWGQGEPYHELVKFKNCITGVSPTGCTATAVAQLMSYWSHPASIDGYNFNWSLIRQYTTTPYRYDGVGTKNIHYANTTSEADLVRGQVARLMERIGFYADASYSCDGTAINVVKSVNFLKNRGYYGGSEMDYSISPVISSLNIYRPVLASGYALKTTNGNTITYSEGHTWVIDGYLRQSRPVTATTIRTSYQQMSNGMIMMINTTTTNTYTEISPYYIHNNWGWNGSPNGFFVAGSFDANYAPTFHSNTKTIGNEGNYQFINKIYPNIYK